MSEWFGKKKEDTQASTPAPAPVRPSDPVPPGARTSGGPKLAPAGAQTVAGIDVSHYEPKVGWDQVVASGQRFVFAKATDGAGSKDAVFDTHRANAHKHDLLFGSYHFMRPGHGLTPKDEAELFLKHTGGVRIGELPLVLDIEWDKTSAKYGEGNHMDELAALEALDTLQRLEDATKITPIIYTSYPFFNGFSKPERFFRFGLWVPAYRVSAPKVPMPWSTWQFWQFSDRLSVAGVGNVDANLFSGPIEKLRAMARQT